MLRNLVKLANELDRRALVKEADYVDRILLKVAQEGTQRSWGQEYYVDERGAGGNVEALQTELGVKADGIFGPNTKAALEAAGGTMGATAAATLEALKAKGAADASGERSDSSVGATGSEEPKSPVDAYVDTTQSEYHQQARDDARAGVQDARQDRQQARINSRHEGQNAARTQRRQNQDERGAPSQRRQQVRENQDTRRDQRRENQVNRRQQREDRQTTRQQGRAERRGYQSNPGGEGGPQQAAPVETPVVEEATE